MPDIVISISTEVIVGVVVIIITSGIVLLYAFSSIINKVVKQQEAVQYQLQEQLKKKPQEPDSAITKSHSSVSFIMDDENNATAPPSKELRVADDKSGIKQLIPRKRSYRIEEEGTKKSSSEYTRRGQLWSRHASWHLPLAPREIEKSIQEQQLQGIEHVAAILRKYDVDPHRGFLPSQDPLQRLPYARYHLWEDLADDLPKLLGARLGQARDPLKQLPALSTDKLVTDAELRRAHLLLCLFAHAYVWGGLMPLDVIPEGIAKPLWEVSERLGFPPILSHTSIVLYNWRRLDAQADVCMENLSTLNNFFDGRDESWFYLITVEIEARGAAAIVPMMLSIDAISRFKEEQSNSIESINRSQRRRSISKSRSYSMGSISNDGVSDPDEDAVLSRLGSASGDGESRDQDRFVMIGSATGENYEDQMALSDALIGELSLSRVATYVTGQLRKIATAVRGMVASLATMREGCHPFIFYHRVRPFLSGWKHNPTLVNGVIYEGVTTERQQFYGGSAAQSSLLPFLDISLGVSHENSKSKDFLMAMRDYMTRPHREFLLYVESVACVREFVTECMEKRLATADAGAPSMDSAADIWTELRDAYDECIEGLKQFRTGHISLVAEYIIAQHKKGEVEKGSLEGTAGGKGTGGTDLMNFLKPIRDNCKDSLLAPAEVPGPTGINDEDTAVKDGGESINGATASIPYLKDNANFEDIDLYRGGTGISSMSAGTRGYKLPVVGW